MIRGRVGVVWAREPVSLSPKVDEYGESLREAVRRLAEFFAAKIQDYAQAQAPWRDQTGQARAGLRAFAVTTATRVVIYLLHTVFYGVFLERGTRFMAPRPIIIPTLEVHYAPFMRAVRNLVGAR